MHSPQQCISLSVSLQLCQQSMLSRFWIFASLVGEKYYLSEVLIYISLIMRKVEYFFHRFQKHFYASLVNCLWLCLPVYKILGGYFLGLTLYLWYLLQIFSPRLIFVFWFPLWYFFAMQNLKTNFESKLSNFYLISPGFWFIIWKVCYTGYRRIHSCLILVQA